MNIKIVLNATLVFCLLVANPAWAYLDPGSASLWIQLILAAIVGLVAASKDWLVKVKDLIKNFFNGKNQN